MKTNDSLEITLLTGQSPKSYFDQIAQLHATSILHGLLPLLGSDFLSCLYQALSKAPDTGVWVALRDDAVVGFLAGSSNVKRAYASVFSKSTFQLMLAAGKALFSFSVIKKLPSVFMYLSRNQHREFSDQCIDPINAELLAIAVNASERGRGVGRFLVETFEKKLLSWGAHKAYCVTTDKSEIGSNAFYQAMGFKKDGTMRHHQMTLQMYKKAIALDIKAGDWKCS